MANWSRSEVIALFGLLVALISCAAGLAVVPEVRQFLGIPSKSEPASGRQDIQDPKSLEDVDLMQGPAQEGEQNISPSPNQVVAQRKITESLKGFMIFIAIWWLPPFAVGLFSTLMRKEMEDPGSSSYVFSFLYTITLWLTLSRKLMPLELIDRFLGWVYGSTVPQGSTNEDGCTLIILLFLITAIPVLSGNHVAKKIWRRSESRTAEPRPQTDG